MAQINFDATAYPQQSTFRDPLDYFKQIDDNNPQEELVLQYLHALHAQACQQGLNVIPVERFYNERSLQTWRAAWEERPTEMRLPTQVDQLHIKFILYNALTPYHCKETEKDIVTMIDRVNRAHKLMSAWLYENRNLETPAARRARQNREAQKRFRARQNDDDQSPEACQARSIKQAYDDYLSACRQRKEAMEQWSAYVDSKKKVWEQLKQQPLPPAQ